MGQQNIYTKFDAAGVYQPEATPVQRLVYALGFIDWYRDMLDPALFPPTDDTFTVVNIGIKIGYDSHPSAYGNAYLGLYNGMCSEKGSSFKEEMVTAIDENSKIRYNNGDGEMTVSVVPIYADKWLNKIYIGAIAPELSFDETNSRFALSSLHSPERITSKYTATMNVRATSGPSASITLGAVVPVPDNNGKECYKINKIFDMRNFCPSLTPYDLAVPIDVKNTTASNEFPLPQPNMCCQLNKVFDMASGIFIEDFNIEENNWNESFWGICGFSYSNLNNENTGNINHRIFDNELGNIAKLTTNANVINDDLLEWYGGGTGVPANKYTPINPKVFILQGGGHTATNSLCIPPMEVLCSSAKIVATNLPTKTLRPYFTIRSDIISDSYFTGGENEPSAMPVIAICQKNQQYGDFYFGSETNTIFTITYPRTITSVKTQICDPSGKPSNLSPNSAVIYKVVKAKISNYNIVDEVMKSNKKN
jgi:hypothetical protein